ncbi:hypothetical protein ABT001_34475 [Streptomyces sp. NPDC002793]|uniref:hypothetical protein n=1 Tax=Streptomyces sp. NPDC002793 TaxID=3154432 RepID=UPI00332C432F
MSDNDETTTTDATGATDTEALQQAMVGQLMAIIGAPDDKDVARAADDIVQELDVRLRQARTVAV